MSRLTFSRTRTVAVACALITASSFASVDAASAVTPSPEGVLTSLTDISVSITAPEAIQRGTAFRAALTVSNLGSKTAESLTCTLTTPRFDAVSEFSVERATKPFVEPVVGGESHWFSIGALSAGATSITTLSGLTRAGSSTSGFTIGAFCFPLPVDRAHQNNLAMITVKLRN